MAKVKTSIRMDEDLLHRIKTILENPLTGKTRYASFTLLLEALLWKWVHEQTKKDAANDAANPANPANHRASPITGHRRLYDTELDGPVPGRPAKNPPSSAR